MCWGSDRWVFPLTINGGSSFFKLDRFLPESCPTIGPQSVANILQDLPVFAIPRSPDSRLKLGSSDANSSNVINHTADFWTASRRPPKIREISQFLLYYCILKIGWYIFFLRMFGEIFVTILLYNFFTFDNPFLSFCAYNSKADEKEK